MTQQLYDIAEIERLYAENAELLAALQAIIARINGDFDCPALMAAGPLSADPDIDVIRIAGKVFTNATPGDGGAQAYIDAAQPVNPYKGTQRPTYYECGCCDQLHSTSFFGDCREDANRFNPEDLDAKHGESRWEIVEMEE